MPSRDASSCQPPWQPLGGCGSIFCLETHSEGPTWYVLIGSGAQAFSGAQVLRMEQASQGWVRRLAGG